MDPDESFEEELEEERTGARGPRFNIKAGQSKPVAKKRTPKAAGRPSAPKPKRKNKIVDAIEEATSQPLLLTSGQTIIPLMGGLFATAEVIVTADAGGAAQAEEQQPKENVAEILDFYGHSLPYSIDLHPSVDEVDEYADYTRIVDRRFPARLRRELYTAFYDVNSTTGHDALWRCDDGEHGVHRLVLATASPLLREIFELEIEENTEAVIDTPDLSSETVKAILCLIYTGRVMVSKASMSDLTTALKMLGFIGQIVSVIPDILGGGTVLKTIEEIEEDIYQVEMEKVFGPKKKKKPTKGGKLAEKKRKKGQETTTPPRSKKIKQIKKDIYASDDYSMGGDDYITGGEPQEDWARAQIIPIYHQQPEKKVKAQNYRHKYFKSIKTPDTRQMFRTRGPGKGDRSYQLASELLDGRHSDFIFICHNCYACFDTEKQFERHVTEIHPDGMVNGPCHTDNPKEFRCSKCNDGFLVKHIAWFCKHLKYCGVDEELARGIVGPEEPSSEIDEDGGGWSGNKGKKYSKRDEYFNDTADRLRITGRKKGKNVQLLSRSLVGKVVDHIWGCRTCYTIYLSEEQLQVHRQEAHGGEDEHGPCWDIVTEKFTCKYCHEEQKCRHVVWFIHHMRRCKGLMEAEKKKQEEKPAKQPKQAKTKKEPVKEEVEEGNDSDINEESLQRQIDLMTDMTDPATAIIYKPYRITTDQSEWICEGLLGRLVDYLYPCHVCYTVYEQPADLEYHFEQSHPPGMVNRIEYGPHYKKQEMSFSCPVCHKLVCKKITTSIFFTYHLRKCSGHTFPQQKTCINCGKEFTSYSTYRQHVESECANKTRACHICGQTFVSVGRLNNHVKYVHSSDKSFPCSQCPKSYKRKADLQVHQNTAHSSNHNFSCEKCGKQFYGKKNLALHMKCHLSKEERPHVCTVCGDRFAKTALLRNHVTKHSDLRQFACEVCGAKVKTHDTLRMHRKKLHNLTTPVPKAAFISDPMTDIQGQSLIKVEVTTDNKRTVIRNPIAVSRSKVKADRGNRNRNSSSSSSDSDTSMDSESVPVPSPTSFAVDQIV